MKTEADKKIWPKMFMVIVKNPLGSGKITKDLRDQRSFRGKQSCRKLRDAISIRFRFQKTRELTVFGFYT